MVAFLKHLLLRLQLLIVDGQIERLLGELDRDGTQPDDYWRELLLMLELHDMMQAELEGGR